MIDGQINPYHLALTETDILTFAQIGSRFVV